jgi:hypothetical protein
MQQSVSGTSVVKIMAIHHERSSSDLRIEVCVTKCSKIGKKLKGKKISVAEDLTYENSRMNTTAHKHSATMSSWTVNGKVFAKLKNGKTVKIPFGADVDRLLRAEMNDEGGRGGGGGNDGN